MARRCILVRYEWRASKLLKLLIAAAIAVAAAGAAAMLYVAAVYADERPAALLGAASTTLALITLLRVPTYKHYEAELCGDEL